MQAVLLSVGSGASDRVSRAMESDPWADYLSRRGREVSSGAGRPVPSWTWNPVNAANLPGRSHNFEDASARSTWAMMQGGQPPSLGPSAPQGRDPREGLQNAQPPPLLSTGTPQGNPWLGTGLLDPRVTPNVPTTTQFSTPGSSSLAGMCGGAAWPGTSTAPGYTPRLQQVIKINLSLTVKNKIKF